MDLVGRRNGLAGNGIIHCVAPQDTDLYMISSRMLEDADLTIRGREKIPEDEGHLNARTSEVKAALCRLYRNGQLDLDFWVCRVCGTPNHPSARQCRGALTIPYPRWKDEVKPLLDRAASFGEVETFKFTAAHRFNEGSVHESDGTPRFDDGEFTDSFFQPFTGTIGHWVVLCDGHVDDTYGGRFLETGDHRGLTRMMSVFASIYCATEELSLIHI